MTMQAHGPRLSHTPCHEQDSHLTMLPMENTYWLHIIESKSPAQDLPSTYTASLAPAPHRHYEGGAMPTVHHPSWEQIAARLSGFGVHKDVITKAQKELDANGSTTIQEVVLSDSQVEQLGFSKAA